MRKTKVKLMLPPNTGKETFDFLKGRKVEQVTQYRKKNYLGSAYLGWKGTTENEFFTATFVSGVITVAIDEREMRLTYTDCLYIVGFSEEAYKCLKAGITKLAEYTTQIYDKELESITFDDIMKLIGWKWKNKRRVDEDMDLS